MKKLYIETYGCQMNFADSEVVAAILKDQYTLTQDVQEADLILINTCSIRDKAEQRIHKRLHELEALKKKHRSLQVGLLGCMAERMKEELFETEPILNFIAGPDSYRNLPQLIENSAAGETQFNVILSEEETYDNIMPVRYDLNGLSCPSCADATTFAPIAWCLTPAGASAAVALKPSCTRWSNCCMTAIRK